MIKCNICERKFKSKRSLASHKNHHNPEYHKKIKKKGSIKSKSIIKENKIKSLNSRKEQYFLNPTLCKHCNNTLPYKSKSNTFCSRSCSVTFNNIGSKHSKESIKKTKRIND